MKYSIILLAFLLSLLACKKDEVTSFIASLRLDSTNFSAPPLPTGSHILAVKFTGDELDNFIGNKLAEVEFYLVEIPSTVEVRVYLEGTSSESPGSLVYQKDITENVEADSWNRHLFETLVDIDGQDIWLCLRVANSGDVPSVGCDPGPAVQNGDWYYTNAAGWETFEDNTSGDVSINWNIRGWVVE